MKRFLHFSLFTLLFPIAAATASAEGFPFGNIGLGTSSAPVAQLDVGKHAMIRGSLFLLGDEAHVRAVGDDGIPDPAAATNYFGKCGIYCWDDENGLVPVIWLDPEESFHARFGGVLLMDGGTPEPVRIYLEEQGVVWQDGDGGTVWARIDPRPYDDPPRFRFQIGDSAFYVSASGVEAAE
jgi:hypothetical protein